MSGFTILPGFVDNHVHWPQFALMGIGGESLLAWLEDYAYPKETRFSDSGYARDISEAFFAARIDGTTAPTALQVDTRFSLPASMTLLRSGMERPTDVCDMFSLPASLVLVRRN